MSQPSFRPISFSWVALHPEPKGIVQFIGGAFFGTFPTLFYRHLFHELYRDGYTLVALPFRFLLSHWQVAFGLLEEHHRLRQLLPSLAERLNYDVTVYQEIRNYRWLGHSLGCKYIALLELLSSNEDTVAASLPTYLIDTYRSSSGIWNQGAVLLAPDISDLESAIPIRFIVMLLRRLGINVRPDRQETISLIRRSNLFNLTAMMSFNRDTVAGSLSDSDETVSDVLWLYRYLKTKSAAVRELSGKHLEPIGWQIVNYIVDFNPFDKFAKALRRWDVANVATELLRSL